MTFFEHEIWDLYDVNRNLTSKTIARGEQIPWGYFHLVVHLCLVNSEGLLLCQKRSITKQTCPLLWDITIGGSAVSKETSKQAMTRETKEELGIDIDFTNIEPFYKYRGIDYFDDYYFVRADIDLNSLVLQKEEVCNAKYFSLEEIENLFKEGRFVPYNNFYESQQALKNVMNTK